MPHGGSLSLPGTRLVSPSVGLLHADGVIYLTRKPLPVKWQTRECSNINNDGRIRMSKVIRSSRDCHVPSADKTSTGQFMGAMLLQVEPFRGVFMQPPLVW